MKRIALALASLTILAATVSAHHSAAMFDGTKLVILKGFMLSFTSLNPHSWISVDARINGTGKSERWDIEATSGSQLAGTGIRSDTLKPGDHVTVGIRPLRDGRHAGSMVFLITPDGIVHGARLADLSLDLASLKP